MIETIGRKCDGKRKVVLLDLLQGRGFAVVAGMSKARQFAVRPDHTGRPASCEQYVGEEWLPAMGLFFRSYQLALDCYSSHPHFPAPPARS